MKNFKMEGMTLPASNFRDLNDSNYNQNLIKGKILVLKCWFINCLACVREFSECNQLVDDYKDRKDILFLSLATDKNQDLKAFLKTSPLAYATIPEMGNYMSDKLRIYQYPTHLLINKTGRIVKVVNSVEELKPFLKAETEK
jgi:peroxiredoxin